MAEQSNLSFEKKASMSIFDFGKFQNPILYIFLNLSFFLNDAFLCKYFQNLI